MIEILDNDMPITVAQKLITATVPCDDFQGSIRKLFSKGDSPQYDMFSDDELLEIAGYLETYVRNNRIR